MSTVTGPLPFCRKAAWAELVGSWAHQEADVGRKLWLDPTLTGSVAQPMGSAKGR